MIFGLSAIKLAMLGVGAGLVIGAGVYVWSLKSDNEKLITNQATLEQALEHQQEATAAAKANAAEWKAHAERVEALNAQVSRLAANLSQQEKKLDTIFEKHDLEALAIAKPGLIEHRVNRAIARRHRMLERATDFDRLRAAGAGEAAGEADPSAP